MYNKEELMQMEPAQLLTLASQLGVKVSQNDDKENTVYAILDKAAEDSAMGESSGAKKKRTRISKKDTDKVYTVSGRDGESLDKKEEKKRKTAKKSAKPAEETPAEPVAEAPKRRGRKPKAAAQELPLPLEEKTTEEPEASKQTDMTQEQQIAETDEAVKGVEDNTALQEQPSALGETPVTADSIDDVWEGDPNDGSDFIIVEDIPIEDQGATPTLDIFDRPMTPSAVEENVQSFTPVTASHQNADYDFGGFIKGNGVLELLQDGYGFLRSSDYNYLSSPDDIYVSAQQIKRYGLKTGDVIECTVNPPHDSERYFTITSVDLINGRNPDEVRDRVSFEHLTPLFPEEKFNLTGDHATTNPSTRIVDLFSPIGKGQRALIVAQPKTGKTILMKDIANAIAANHPEAYIMMLLIDERPEEVTDMSRTVNAEVIASTFDEPADRHVKIAGIVLEKAKRMVECGHDVVIFLDSITRLARAYNTVSPASGKVLTGGVDANALQKPKRFFGAARKIEGGGSLTIIATALVDTGSKMDEVIFEEFKGTGNSEIQLSRSLSNKRIFPSIDLVQSSTRRDDLLQDETTLNRMWIIRKLIAEMNPLEAMNFVRDRLVQAKDNAEFLMSMNG